MFSLTFDVYFPFNLVLINEYARSNTFGRYILVLEIRKIPTRPYIAKLCNVHEFSKTRIQRRAPGHILQLFIFCYKRKINTLN